MNGSSWVDKLREMDGRENGNEEGWGFVERLIMAPGAWFLFVMSALAV